MRGVASRPSSGALVLLALAPRVLAQDKGRPFPCDQGLGLLPEREPPALKD